MPVPPQPYIDIQAAFTSGSIIEDGTVNWYNSGASSCKVTDVGSWCQQSEYDNIPAGGYVTATVLSVSGTNFSYRSGCLLGGMPVVIVHPIHPVAVKKTA